MIITSGCRQPACSGTVRFSQSGRARNGRFAGTCDRCQSLHSLYGGQIRLESQRRSRRRDPEAASPQDRRRWSPRSMVS